MVTGEVLGARWEWSWVGVFSRTATVLGGPSGAGAAVKGPSLAWAPRQVLAMCSCFYKF